MSTKDIVKTLTKMGVYIPMVSYHFFSGLQTCAKTDKFAAIKILHGLNMFQDLQSEKEAVDWLMTIIVKA